MKLYYAPGACSLGAHIAAIEAGLKIDLERVDLRAKKTESGDDYWAVNPKGAVPALEIERGEVLTESAVVLQYLAEQSPGSSLMPPAGTLERWRLLEMLNFVATELHKGFGPLWNPATTPEAREAAVKVLGKKFDYVEGWLSHGPYLTGETFTIADAYAFAVLSWTRLHKVDLGAWPNVRAYLERVGDRPAVRQALAEEGLG